MNDEPIIARRRKIDGKLVPIFPDGREEALPDLDRSLGGPRPPSMLRP
jgi:hypothetical protein